ncbi:MAG: hypothetical protein ACPGIJ_14150, partial [Mycobacterium sp.]
MSKEKKAEEKTSTPEDDTAVGADTKVGETTESTQAGASAEVEDDEKAATDEEKPAADSEAADSEAADSEDADSDDAGAKEKRRIQWPRVVAFGLLPALALVLALGAGYLKWRDNSVRNGEIAAATSVQAAKDTTIAMLSYQPETVEEQLQAARDLLTGDFRESYTALTDDVVIPGAKEKQIAAVASVPAARTTGVVASMDEREGSRKSPPRSPNPGRLPTR